MKIPVFVSSPTALNPHQERQRKLICQQLEELNLEARALGRSDYPSDLPLREVYTIAKHCSGGVILGFSQFTAHTGTRKAKTKQEKIVTTPTLFPTEWNNLEAGILYALGKPLLVFRESGISGGVFDPGVSDVFVHNMPALKAGHSDLKEIFLKWRDKVGTNYYS